MAPPKKYKDIEPGDVFGELTVLRRSSARINAGRIPAMHKWVCLCSCGSKSDIIANNLNRGVSQCFACGVQERASRRLGAGYYSQYPDMEWRYKNMMSRCYNPKNEAYADYGGRGITVCARWRNERTGFLNYVADMGTAPPSPGMSIDRENNDRGYSPKNCRWATQMEQVTNRRQQHNSKLYRYKGQDFNLHALARHVNIPKHALSRALARGVPVAKAIKQLEKQYAQ